MPNHRFASGADEKLVRVFDATKNFLDNVSAITGHDFTGYSFSDQQIFCHQLTQNMTTDFFRFMKIYTNGSEIQNLQNLNFRTIFVSKSDKISSHILGKLVTKDVYLTKNNL